MISQNSDYGMVLTTVGTEEDATRIAKHLLEEKFAACVQLLPIQSFYAWKGEITSDKEVLLLIKTQAALFSDTIVAIKRVHPYEVPEIVASKFVSGLSDYFEWIKSVTG